MKNKMFTGKHIGIAILDTGIFPHRDFYGRIRGFADFINGRQTPYDDNGHGTHVAGIAGGNGAAWRGKYCGIAPECDLIACKVLDENGSGDARQVISALEWIKKNRERYGIRIINISVGTTQKSAHEDLILAVEEAWDAGLIVVAAAGNMGPGQGTITAPGSSRKIITVGSSDMLIQNQGISGRGPTNACIVKPDIVAPGNRIVSCANRMDRMPYMIKSGTSMSTPVVSGGIALLLEKTPYLTNLDIKKRLRSTAKDLGYPHNLQGWGLFCLENFLEWKNSS
ncbi:MAG: S8 family peptidase [Blautia sp.]